MSLASPRHATVYDVLEEAKPKVPPFAMGDLDDSELPSLEALVAEVCGGKLANELTGAIQSAKEQPAATQQPTGGLNLDHFSTAQLRAHLAESNNMKKKSGTSSRLRYVQACRCPPLLLSAHARLTEGLLQRRDQTLHHREVRGSPMGS